MRPLTLIFICLLIAVDVATQSKAASVNYRIHIYRISNSAEDSSTLTSDQINQIADFVAVCENNGSLSRLNPPLSACLRPQTDGSGFCVLTSLPDGWQQFLRNWIRIASHSGDLQTHVICLTLIRLSMIGVESSELIPILNMILTDYSWNQQYFSLCLTSAMRALFAQFDSLPLSVGQALLQVFRDSSLLDFGNYFSLLAKFCEKLSTADFRLFLDDVVERSIRVRLAVAILIEDHSRQAIRSWRTETASKWTASQWASLFHRTFPTNLKKVQKAVHQALPSELQIRSAEFARAVIVQKIFPESIEARTLFRLVPPDDDQNMNIVINLRWAMRKFGDVAVFHALFAEASLTLLHDLCDMIDQDLFQLYGTIPRNYNELIFFIDEIVEGLIRERFQYGTRQQAVDIVRTLQNHNLGLNGLRAYYWLTQRLLQLSSPPPTEVSDAVRLLLNHLSNDDLSPIFQYNLLTLIVDFVLVTYSSLMPNELDEFFGVIVRHPQFIHVLNNNINLFHYWNMTDFNEEPHLTIRRYLKDVMSIEILPLSDIRFFLNNITPKEVVAYLTRGDIPLLYEDAFQSTLRWSPMDLLLTLSQTWNRLRDGDLTIAEIFSEPNEDGPSAIRRDQLAQALFTNKSQGLLDTHLLTYLISIDNDNHLLSAIRDVTQSDIFTLFVPRFSHWIRWLRTNLGLRFDGTTVTTYDDTVSVWIQRNLNSISAIWRQASLAPAHVLDLIPLAALSEDDFKFCLQLMQHNPTSSDMSSAGVAIGAFFNEYPSEIDIYADSIALLPLDSLRSLRMTLQPSIADDFFLKYLSNHDVFHLFSDVSVSQESKMKKCEICFDLSANKVIHRLPKTSEQYHTACSVCLQEWISKRGSAFNCPFCRHDPPNKAHWLAYFNMKQVYEY